MKNRLLWVTAALFLASCGQANKEAPTAEHVEKPGDGGSDPVTINTQGTLVSLETANRWIDHYHRSVDLGHNPDQQVSFMLNADVLREYLNSDTSFHKLDVYLVKKDGDTLDLVYVGARWNPSLGEAGEWQEIPYSKGGDDTVQYMFNHGIPCPKCDRDPLHTPPSEQ